MSNITTLHNPVPLPRRAKARLGDYDPLTERRRCSNCGQRNGWRRLLHSTNPGGWVCCGWVEEPATRHGDLAHTCSAICWGVPA